MLRRLGFILAFCTFIPIFAFGQCRISGTIKDAGTGERLAFAHVWVKALDAGTTTDSEGHFRLSVPCGTHTLRASFMGYDSEYRKITASSGDSVSIMISLRQAAIKFPEVVVLPGENPAIPIIKKAIEAKNKIAEKLNNYSVEAHSKLTIEFVDLPIGDTTFQKLMESMKFPFETLTKAYWAKPDRRKEIINARRQPNMGRDNFNTMTSMPARINFSSDVLPLGPGVTGPISEDGLDDYWYDLLGTTSYNGEKVYRIGVTPRSDIEPLMSGTIFIADSTYLLVMVDANFNEAALGSVIDTLRFRQQFSLVENEFWLPTNAAISVDMRMKSLITVKAKVGIHSILKEYNVNDPAMESVFDDFLIVVADSADDLDSLEWEQRSMIPSTEREMRTLYLSDSLQTDSDEQKRQYTLGAAILGRQLEYGDTVYSVPGLLDIYNFNRVEGHGFNAAFGVKNFLPPVLETNASLGYGFYDERWKWSLETDVSLYKRTGIHAWGLVFNRLTFIDEDEYYIRNSSMPFLHAMFDFDPRDFFYTAGWKAGIGGYATNTIEARLYGGYEHTSSAQVNTNEHLFRENEPYPPLPQINDGYITTIGAGLLLDTRNRILNKGTVERVNGRNMHYPSIGAEMNYAALPDQSWPFTIYDAGLRGTFGLGGWGSLSYRLHTSYSDNMLPVQRLINLQGSDNGITTAWRFRTATLREFGGDQTATAFAEWNAGTILQRAIGVPEVDSIHPEIWELIFFGGAGYSDMREATRNLIGYPIEPARTPFYELGFGIGNIAGLFRLDFAWRMNHFRDGRNFFWGLSISPQSLIGK